jgi:hypothetical protein
MKSIIREIYPRNSLEYFGVRKVEIIGFLLNEGITYLNRVESRKESNSFWCQNKIAENLIEKCQTDFALNAESCKKFCKQVTLGPVCNWVTFLNFSILYTHTGNQLP